MAKKYSNIFTVRVNEHNRITIPKTVANIYNIKQGDIVTVAVLEITKIKDTYTISLSAKDVDVDAGDYEEMIDA